MHQQEKGISALKALGLTEIEALVYSFLLKKNPETGYGIAQTIGKPVANIYKAIKSLEYKGAVMVEEDTKRLYRPLPLTEFMSLLERQFKDNKESVLQELTRMESIAEDERVYQMRSVDQILEQSRAMLKRAEQIVLIDVFPKILRPLISDIQKTAQREIEIIIKAYDSISIPNVEVIIDSRGAKVVKDYPGQWLRIAIDAREHLLAFLSSDIKYVHQAIWSSSRFLSFLHYCGIRDEILIDKVGHLIHGPCQISEIHQVLRGYMKLEKNRLPGYKELLEQFSSIKSLIKENRQK